MYQAQQEHKLLEERVVPTVRAMISNPSSQFLLIQRGPGLEEGLWCLPGGKNEPGEDAYAAMVREVEEEAGLQERLDFVIVYRIKQLERNNGTVYGATYFICNTVDGGEARIKLDGVEAVDFQWVSAKGALRMDLAFNGGEGLCRLLQDV